MLRDIEYLGSEGCDLRGVRYLKRAGGLSGRLDAFQGHCGRLNCTTGTRSAQWDIVGGWGYNGGLEALW